MKRAILQVSVDFLVEACKWNPAPHFYQVAENALPADAKAVGGHYDSLRELFTLAVESESFADIPDGEPLPVLPPPTFQEVRRV